MLAEHVYAAITCTKSAIGSEPVRRSNRGPLTLCAGHSADSVTASQQIPVAVHTGARHVPNSGQAPI
jgi:hypothetical protein